MKWTTGRTATFLGAYVFLGLIGLLVLELFSYAGGASISKTMTTVWNAEPWIVFVVGTMISFAWGFLCGHWFGQKRPEQYARRPG